MPSSPNSSSRPTQPRRRTFATTAAAAVAAGLVLAACSSSVPSSEGPAVTPTVGASSDGSTPAAPDPSIAPTDAATPDASPAAEVAAGGSACELVTEQEVGAALGKDPGPGSPFTSHGSSQCQYGTFQTSFVLVNLNPTQGQAFYERTHGDPKVARAGVVSDIAGVGDEAFEVAGPNTASIYFLKGDALVLVMVEVLKATSPPKDQVLALAKTAADRA